MNKMVLIIGCGRSGTHWLGEFITSIPGFSGTVTDMLGIPGEVGTDLQRLRKACEVVAYDPAQGGPLFPEIEQLYGRLRAAYPPHYVDKTHGFIWGVEILAEIFPEAIFVGIEREIEPVVASLINRNGSMRARRAGQAWKKYPVPSAPGGISSRIAEGYESMTIEERAALVWKAHNVKMRLLARDARMMDRLWFVRYEAMLGEPAMVMNELERVLKVPAGSGTVPAPDHTANKRWHSELGPTAIRAIREIRDSGFYECELDALCAWHAAVLRGASV